MERQGERQRDTGKQEWRENSAIERAFSLFLIVCDALIFIAKRIMKKDMAAKKENFSNLMMQKQSFVGKSILYSVDQSCNKGIFVDEIVASAVLPFALDSSPIGVLSMAALGKLLRSYFELRFVNDILMPFLIKNKILLVENVLKMYFVCVLI
jgi:hypothetical protein